ncbi:MAG: response regulator transcription factor [Hydrogenophilales bacterium]|nr:response regulator transcription factor [Hydrogenophilales bacterium]
MKVEATVSIVDDDISVRDSLSLLLGLKGFRTLCFARAEDFLETYRPEWSGCLILDIRMAGMDGLALQQELRSRRMDLPVIILTAHGNLETARKAFKAGAVDFFEKPVDGDVIIEAVREALARQASSRRHESGQERARALLEQLSERERQVLDMLADGKHTREIGAELGISPRTVEVYKNRLMDKTDARKLPDLVRLVLEAREK